MTSNPVSPKVTSATLTTAAVTLVMYVLGQISFVADMPELVKGALLVLVTAGLTFAAGYMRRDPLRVPLSGKYLYTSDTPPE